MRRKKGIIVFTALLILILSCKKKGEQVELQAKGGNNPPKVFEVTVSPRTITSQTPITLTVRARDPEGSAVNLRYIWLVNGEEIDATGDKLENASFKKGDTITAIITPDDGELQGEPYRIDIPVSNSPPEVKDIEITPRTPVYGEDLSVKADVFDADGDDVHLSYAWSVNNTLIEDAKGNTLSAKYFKKGDSVTVEVIPSDDESTGVSMISNPITIANSPPRILSTPPSVLNGNRYTYQVIANDPDGDEISFYLENAPEGMSIDEKSGLINWQITPDTKGSYTYTIIVQDADGARSTQTVTVGF